MEQGKIILTGATGFLGSHIAHRLIREGHETIILKRSTSDMSRIEDIRKDLVTYDIDQNPAETAFREPHIRHHTCCN